MLKSVAVWVQHLKQTVVAQQHHVAHLITLCKRGMGRHDETAPFTQLVDHVLLHVEVLHERKVGAIHRLGPNADLVRLAKQAITMFVSRDIVLFISVMRIDAHIVGNAVMVVAKSLIDAVNSRFLALAPVGQAEKLARMAMEMVFLPLVGVHVLIRVVEVLTLKRSWLLETVGGHGEVDVQDDQQQSDAEARHYPAEIKPKAVFLYLAHSKFIRLQNYWKKTERSKNGQKFRSNLRTVGI